MAATDQKLQRIIEILKAEFCPERIFLFGSRARGDYRANSDYDLVLIGGVADIPKVERMQKASDLLYPLGVTADVFFYTKEEFNDWKQEFSSIAELATREGRELDLG